jgi:hypothetical protein
MGDVEDAGMFDLEIEGAHWSNNICIQYSIDTSEESGHEFFPLLGYRVMSPGRRSGNLAKFILASLLLNECVVSWPAAAKVQKFGIMKPSNIKTSHLINGIYRFNYSILCEA